MNTSFSRPIRLPFLSALLLLLLVSAACSPATSTRTLPEPTLDAAVESGALTEVTPAAEPTTVALAPAPAAAPSATPDPVDTEPVATAEPEAYPEPVAESQPVDAYPMPEMAESLEAYPGVTIIGAPEGLDLDPATLGTSLPTLLEQFTNGERALDIGTLDDDPLLTLILADAASRAEIEPGDLGLLSIELVTWPDTSLGCPNPERGYAQVQIEGYMLTLSAEASTYTYHTDGDLQVVLCQNGAPLSVRSAPQQ